MELGEKLRRARLEMGLSQKALCGGQITRNMLSQIENGSARPSMKTLRYLASQLGKPMSYFLEEEASISPNQQAILAARQCFDDRDYAAVLKALQAFRQPDEVFGRERVMLENASRLALGRQAAESRREPLARDLLKGIAPGPYWSAAQENQRLELLARLGEKVALPSLDGSLMLRADAAWRSGSLDRATALLEAVEQRTARWHLLRGRVYYGQKQYRLAAAELQQAESIYPKETVPQLEGIFRELGDYEKAYAYACKARVMD